VRTDNVFGPAYLSAVEPQSDAKARFYRRLAENSLGLMCCHDLTGVLLWVNPAAARSLGYSCDQAVGSSIEGFLAPEVQSEFKSYLDRIRRTGFDTGFMRLRDRHGHERIWMYRNIISDDPELPVHVVGHALDVTEQLDAKRALKTLFERAPIAQIELEPSGKLRRINPVACELLGYTAPEIFSFDGSGPPDLADLFRESCLVGDTGKCMRFVRKDGCELHLELFARHIPASNSSPAGIICALINVSDRVRAEAEIRNLNAQLEAKVNLRTAELRRSNAELQEFACIVSHDLQAPLKQVGSILDELGSNSFAEDKSELLRLCRADIERMAMLIDSLLGYAVVSNRADIVARRVPLAVSVQESLMNLASVVASSNAIVNYENLPEVSVDEADFVQLFQNLIENAIKYRGAHNPRIRITASEIQDEWVISVSDNGIGIDKAQCSRIFQAFQRLHGKEYPGSGIGLAICKKIVERTGGRIWVESERDLGSTFRFTVPH